MNWVFFKPGDRVQWTILTKRASYYEPRKWIKRTGTVTSRAGNLPGFNVKGDDGKTHQVKTNALDLLPRECPNCWHVHNRNECPECGFSDRET